ncbi:MAG: hypothetical protein KIT25_11495 [Enhydrobacter sp.]|nr:MAG: hypothetical protein KIT25_11495 [Enhydrobacter sp.]
MSEAEPLATIAIVVGLLAALILAWRAYRGAAQDHEERKRERQDRDDRD